MYDTSEALEDRRPGISSSGRGRASGDGPFRTVRSPVSFDGERALEVRPPPTLGEHGEEIRQELAARRKAPTGAPA